MLSAADAIWSELKVWQDLDQDGKTEGDGAELKTLADWGISEIGLSYDDGTAFDDESNDVTVFGNTLHGQTEEIYSLRKGFSMPNLLQEAVIYDAIGLKTELRIKNG